MDGDPDTPLLSCLLARRPGKITLSVPWADDSSPYRRWFAAGTLFGDGLRCAGGTVVRLATKTNVGGASQYPDVGDPPLSVQGGVIA